MGAGMMEEHEHWTARGRIPGGQGTARPWSADGCRRRLGRMGSEWAQRRRWSEPAGRGVAHRSGIAIGAVGRRVDRELARPAFVRAQVGFNNNVKYKDQTFHIQTEDSGLDKPHVITHLFADGGRVIKSHKRSYAEYVNRPDVTPYVRQLMKGQQLEMALALREGRFDAVIEGHAMGGMDVLDYPPKADLQKLATKKKTRVPADGDSVRPPKPDEASKAEAPAPATEKPRAPFRLSVVRSLTGGPSVYEPNGTEAVIGSSGSIGLPGERFCHPR